MNQHREKTCGRKASGKLRRGLALLMAVVLMIPTQLPGMSFTAHAAGDPPLTDEWQPVHNQYPFDKGGGDTTAYYFQKGKVAQSGGAFNIQGIKVPEKVGAEDPWMGGTAPSTAQQKKDYYEGAIQTTYDGTGYKVYLSQDRQYHPEIGARHNGQVDTSQVANFGVQTKIKIHPSPDGSAVLVDYYVHNMNNANNTVYLATSANIRLGGGIPADNYNPQVDPADASKLEIIAGRGFHMVNRETNETFELITDDAKLGCTPTDTNWVGNETYSKNNLYSNSPDKTVEHDNSALNYSWTINMEPNQTVMRRVAFKVGAPSYYVSESGDDNNAGDFTAPYKTIDRAVMQIARTPFNPNKIGTVYFQSDYKVPKTISIPSTALNGYTITLSSTDYDRNGKPSDAVYTASRAAGFNGTMADLTSNSIKITNLTIDGGPSPSVGPIVDISDTGSLMLIHGAVLQNNNNTAASAVNPNQASAIQVTGNGSLHISGGTVRSNSGGVGAISFNSGGDFTLEGAAVVNENTNSDGKKGNIYLASGKRITVNGNMEGAHVGVTAQDVPQPSVEGPATDANQEVIVAVPKDATVAPADQSCPFAQYFFADGAGEQPHPGLITAPGNLAGDQSSWVNTVLRLSSYKMDFQIKTTNTAPPIQNPPVIASQTIEGGSDVSGKIPLPPNITSYKLDHVEFSNGVTTLQADETGAITGTMPAQAVMVTYVYREIRAGIAFHTNGGTPATIDRWEGPAGQATGKPMPTVTKAGYAFKGWSKQNGGDNPEILPAAFFNTYPNEEAEVYAIFAPDPAQPFDFTMKYEYQYQDAGATKSINFKTVGPTPTTVEATVPQAPLPPVTVAGYTWSQALSGTDPAGIGGFDASGNYTGTMPAQALTAYSRYAQDLSKSYPLTIRHQSAGGVELVPAAEPVSYHAGDAVSADPLTTIPHFTCTGFHFDAGTSTEPTEDGLIYPVSTDPDQAYGWHWSDRMPNQPVTLTYIYTANQGDKASVQETYYDDATTDEALKKLPSPPAKEFAVDDEAQGDYAQPYGYNPVYPFTLSAADAQLTDLKFGTEGAAQNHWSGHMPPVNVTIDYHNTRDANKWANILYKAGDNGQLTGTPGTDISSDVTRNGDGTYQASILISDGSPAGQAAAYKFSDIEAKKLIPTYSADTNYTFAGWILDASGNGSIDPGEEYVTENTTFTGPGPIKLIAAFKKNAVNWMDIQFDVDKGTYQSGAKTQNVLKTAQWKDVTNLPVYAPWDHYAEDGWYEKNNATGAYTPMTPTTPLKEKTEVTYVHRFQPNTADKFAYTVEHVANGPGPDGNTVTFKTDTTPSYKWVEGDVTADKLTVPGYTWVQEGGWATDPATYAYDHVTPIPIGTVDGNGHFAGKMPGQPLKVTYKYAVDRNQTFKLTVNYRTASGAEVAPSRTDEPYHAGDTFNAAPEGKDGYKYDHFEFAAGKEATGTDGLQRPVVGEPADGTGIWTNAVMPNQDVTLNYIYIGDPAKTYTVTEKYIGTGRTGYAVEPISEEVVKTVPADTYVEGAYQTPHGYQFKTKGSKIEFNPAAPAGNDLKLDTSGQAWSGHMPAANVTITYTNDRIPDKWVTVTYKAGNHGSIQKVSGMSGSLFPVNPPPESGPQFYIDVLKDDESGDPAIPNWKYFQDHKMIPLPSPISPPETPNLYKFEGWFVDTNGDGDRQETEPLLTDTTTFKTDTTLTASFIKDMNLWMEINLVVENGNLTPPDAPTSLTVPKAAHWNDAVVQNQLPNYTPWTNYRKKGWYDGSNVGMLGDGSGGTINPQMENNGTTYTAKCEPDPNVTFLFTVQHENQAGEVFQKLDAAPWSIEGHPTASKIDVPGYKWAPAPLSKADPAEYNFDKNHAGVMESTGSFAANGDFTGKMPGAPLTVHYLYNPITDPQDPGYQAFTLTVQYQTADGTNLVTPFIDTAMTPEKEINKPSETITGYKCTSFRKDAGWTADPAHGILAVANDPTQNGAGSYNWNTRMPNQNVTLTYLYEPDTGGTTFNITEKYMDVTDGEPGVVIQPDSHEYSNLAPLTDVTGGFADLFGYDAQIKGDGSCGTITLETAGVPPTIQWKNGAEAGHWSGKMPPSNVTVTYQYKRHDPADPGQSNWADLYYKPAILDKDQLMHGSLSTTSPDVTQVTPGTNYKTRILVSDGTPEGNAAAWTWSTLQTKGRVPSAAAEEAGKYYEFSGWYIDNNDDGHVDAGDTFLGKGDGQDTTEADRYFSTAANDPDHNKMTLLAAFTEREGQWIDIHFTANKGSLSGTSTADDETLHIQSGKTWGDTLDRRPTYSAWLSYIDDGWYKQNQDGSLGAKMTDQTILEKGATYVHNFIPNAVNLYNFVTIHQSDTPDLNIVFSSNEANPESYAIEHPVTAAPKTIPGYTLNKNDTTTDPPSYNFVPGVPTLFSTYFDGDMNFAGMMPGGNLKVIYKYTPDTTHHFLLNVKYVTDTGVPLQEEIMDSTHPAEDPITIEAKTFTGYTCTRVEVTKGQTATDTESALQGQPLSTTADYQGRMPNQDVTVIYTYTGNTGDAKKITENYTNVNPTGATDDPAYAADPAQQTIPGGKVSAATTPGTAVNGTYVQPYGYTMVPEGPVIAYNPENPAGADLKFDNANVNWSGHMPAADVTITYNHKRDLNKWVKLTYTTNGHGSLSALDAAQNPLSPDLKQGTEAGTFTANVLKNDPSDNKSLPWDWQTISVTNKLAPTPVKESELYYFAGWFIDKNSDNKFTDDEKVLNNTVFDADTTLTAVFKEADGKWIDVFYGAEKGDLTSEASYDITHIPSNSTWAVVSGSLPEYAPWPGYIFDNWYDKDVPNVPMAENTAMVNGHTYIARFKPNPTPDPQYQYNYTIQYENEDGTLIFKKVPADGQPAVKKVIEDPLEALDPPLINVPGYEWDKGHSYLDPAAYDFDHYPATDAKTSTGTFGADGQLLNGRMPGQALTVHYRYKVKQAPSPGDQFTLTIHYQSDGGAKLKDDVTIKGVPGTPITGGADSPVIANYTVDRYVKGATGWTADPNLGILPMATEPVKAGDHYTWTGVLPNQNVELTYIYRGSADPGVRFNITEKYMDITDGANPRLISTKLTPDCNVDQEVQGIYTKPYGYDTQGTPVIEVAGGLMTNIAFGYQGDNNQWHGNMPAGDVTITYNHVRHTDPTPPEGNHWAKLTYKSLLNGSLAISEDQKKDIHEVTPGSVYQTDILIDSADGQHDGWTWQYIKKNMDNKSLVPTANPNRYYQFDGWYIDNGTTPGELDNSDTPLGKGDAQDTAQANATTFTGDTQLLANFTEITDAWIDISFTTENASLDGNPAPEPVTLHIQSDKTWDDIQDRLPNYTSWPSYADDGWYQKGTGGQPDVKMAIGAHTPLVGGATYVHRFVSDGAQTYDLITEHQSDSGILFHSDEGEIHNPHPINYPIGAEPLTIPGYKLHMGAGGTTTEPLSYQFVPGTDTLFATYFNNETGRFSGKMPGKNLKVIYKYTPDSQDDPQGTKFLLTVRYQSASGNTLAPEHSEEHAAEHPFDIRPADVTGYTCTGFDITAGKAPSNTTSAVQGEPDGNDGYHWVSKMPNQPVTIIYTYTGTAGATYKYTQKYVDTGAQDPDLADVIDPVISGETAPDAAVQGDYAPQTGYNKSGAAITCNPENPAGYDLTWNADQTHWSGHMPAANVLVTYSLSRIPDSWATITYQAGAHGNLSDGGKSADLLAGPDGKYTVKVLKNSDKWNFGALGTKKLVPGTVPADPLLYSFDYWFIDENGNGSMDGQDRRVEPTAPFPADTTLTAAFKENTGAWIDVTYSVDRGTFTKEPDLLVTHIPENSPWSRVSDRLNDVVKPVPWSDEYIFKGWYDDADPETPMAADTTMIKGHNYTARFIVNPNPDPQYQYNYTVQYENEDGSLIFKKVPADGEAPVTKLVEDPIHASKIDVPGYEWVPGGVDGGSYLDPAEYDFDHNAQTAAEPTGSFGTNGDLLNGKMPGQDLTVHYRYKLKEHPTPDTDLFTLTIHYKSVGGATLKEDYKPLKKAAPGTAIPTNAADSPVIDGFTIKEAVKITGWDANPKQGIVPMLTAPEKAGDADHYTWSGVLPNQNVELTYLYQPNTLPGVTYHVTEKYLDVTDTNNVRLISEASTDWNVDAMASGSYHKPHGYKPATVENPFTVKVDTQGVLTDIAFGTDGQGQADPNAWSGHMPASNVTITYRNVRDINPQPPTPASWAKMTYKSLANGRLSISEEQQKDIQEVPPDSGVYQTDILIDSSAEAHDGWTWQDLKKNKDGKSLVPTAVPFPDFYQFDGWYIDNGTTQGVLDDGDTPLGKGDDNDTALANATTFAGDTQLLANFIEVPDQWINVSYAAEKGTLDAAPGLKITHVKVGTNWNWIMNNGLPGCTAWPGYRNTGDGTGWYQKKDAGNGTFELTPMTGDKTLEKDGTYVYICKPDDAQAKELKVIYTAPADDGTVITLFTDARGSANVEKEVKAQKKKIPGYTWDAGSAENKADPAAYDFNQDGTADPMTESTGSFDADGNFTGIMPAMPMTVYYRYKLSDNPDPGNTFKLTVRYQTVNGGPVNPGAEIIEQVRAPGSTIDVTPPEVANYECIGVPEGDLIKGFTPTDQTTVVADKPSTTPPYTWHTRMPNQDVELIYRYKPTGGETPNQYRITENYMDVTDGLNAPQLIDTKEHPYNQDAVVGGTFELPYGYDVKQKDGTNDFTVAVDGNLATNIAFGFNENPYQWHGVMPAGNVTITYNLIRHVDPSPDVPKIWKDMQYIRTDHGTLSTTADTPEVKEVTPGSEYKASILVSDKTAAGDAGAYTWKMMKDKHLVPTAQEDPHYTFKGWYYDKNHDGIIQHDSDANPDTYLGKGDGNDSIEANALKFNIDDPLQIIADFEETPGDWINLNFAAVNGTIKEDVTMPVHIPAGTYTWKQVLDANRQIAEPWSEDYYLDPNQGWTAPNGQTMTDTTKVTVAGTYTAHFIPDPTKAKNFFVKHVTKGENGNPDGVLTITEDMGKPDIGSEITASAKQIQGYTWKKSYSSIEPSEYQLNPAQPASSTGDFISEAGDFSGHMPGAEMTVTYGYRLNPDAHYKLTIEGRIAGTGTTIYSHEAPGLAPGSDQEISAPKLDGYVFDGKHVESDITAGKAETTADHTMITAPVAGEPDDNNNGLWKFKMPNQDVTVVYYYTVDPNAMRTITEKYIDLDAPAGHQEITTVVSDPILVGTAMTGSYPELYGYVKAGQGKLTNGDIEMDGERWDGARIEVTEGGNGWSGPMPPRNVTITYKYTEAGTNPNPGTDPENPNPPTPEHPWGNIYYLLSTDSEGKGRLDKGTAAIDPYQRAMTAPDGQTKQQNGFSAKILFDNRDVQMAEKYPYTIGDLTTKNLLPTPTPLPVGTDYYTFAGWFIDSNNNGTKDENEDYINKMPQTDTFDINSALGAKTLRAQFVETPGRWTKIYLAVEHSNMQTAPKEVDVPKLMSWGRLVTGDADLNLAPLPTYTQDNAEVNYVLGGWYDMKDRDHPIEMTSDMPIKEGWTYTYRFIKDPEIFGTNVTTPEASGGLDGRGKGKITLYDTKEGMKEGDYNYILTDPSGKILEIIPKLSRSQRVAFEGYQPEGEYDVYEALPTFKAHPGDNISQVPGGIAGKDYSENPADVWTPVLTDNYDVYYNDPTGENDQVRLAIQPADPDSEYAVLDAGGNVVPIQGAKEGGWISLSGSEAAIQIPNLTYNAQYTVVARPKGRTDITTESQAEQGTVITAAPVGEANLKQYIIKATLGDITSVTASDGTVKDVEDSSCYTEAHKNDQITLSAPSSNSDGEDFQYWEVTIGSKEDLKKPNDPSHSLDQNDFAQQDISFIMPGENLVLTPVFKHNAYPNAKVTDAVRGGNAHEISLDPNAIPDMERTLTNPDTDGTLIETNKTDVVYKMIYKKGGVTKDEATALKQLSDHKDAFRAAWGLDVSLERYVNGRPVPTPASASDAQTTQAEQATASDASLPIPASASDPSNDASNVQGEVINFSNPESYKTYIQMGKDDVDMMDYRLYEVKDGGYEPVDVYPVNAVETPDHPAEPGGETMIENTGGLFTFNAKPGSRYVMVYSKAYHLYYNNQLAYFHYADKGDFKVRQNEAPGGYPGYEAMKDIAERCEYQIRPATGAEYYFKYWTFDQNKKDNPRQFDPSRPIKNTTLVYAYYSDNEAEVAEARRQLEQTIKDAEKLSRDPFLKRSDSEKLKGDIDKAIGVINMEDPRALQSWLEQTREWLLGRMKIYQDLLKATQDAYDEIQSHNSGGGGSGGGGGGSGIKSNPYNPEPTRNYTVGNNGDWKLLSDVPGQPKQWAFVIHGGMMLRSTWAYLQYPDVTNAATGWYHFNANAIMDTGWYTDEKGKWYYSYKEGEGPEGKMATGWHLDTADGNWYYLDPVNGDMVTGWRQVDGKWYYMETVGANAYVHDPVTGLWTYSGTAAGHPLGSMYKNETTPDGYTVDANGARIQ